jgi:molybdopterin converting factor small subunit
MRRGLKTSPFITDMPLVEFTANLAHQTSAPACKVAGATVGEALANVFAANPSLRGYVLDDQGAVRRHVVVFLDGTAIRDRTGLSDPVREDSEIFVMQALSGG